MTGYAQADAYTQILDLACKNKEFTREGILNAFHSMKTVETGGLLVPLDFTRGYGKSQRLETLLVRP